MVGNQPSRARLTSIAARTLFWNVCFFCLLWGLMAYYRFYDRGNPSGHYSQLIYFIAPVGAGLLVWLAKRATCSAVDLVREPDTESLSASDDGQERLIVYLCSYPLALFLQLLIYHSFVEHNGTFLGSLYVSIILCCGEAVLAYMTFDSDASWRYAEWEQACREERWLKQRAEEESRKVAEQKAKEAEAARLEAERAEAERVAIVKESQSGAYTLQRYQYELERITQTVRTHLEDVLRVAAGTISADAVRRLPDLLSPLIERFPEEHSPYTRRLTRRYEMARFDIPAKYDERLEIALLEAQELCLEIDRAYSIARVAEAFAACRNSVYPEFTAEDLLDYQERRLNKCLTTATLREATEHILSQLQSIVEEKSRSADPHADPISPAAPFPDAGAAVAQLEAMRDSEIAAIRSSGMERNLIEAEAERVRRHYQEQIDMLTGGDP